MAHIATVVPNPIARMSPVVRGVVSLGTCIGAAL
jgi:hypothetical protein